MPELYEIEVEYSQIAFKQSQEDLPKFALAPEFDPSKAPPGLGVVCRMGAPDQFHCVIFRGKGRPGGIFALHEQGELLFVALAKSNLAYGLAKGFFGSLVASSRYGVDIYESDEPDD